MQALDLVLSLPMTGALSADPAEILRRMVERWLPAFFRPMECRAVVSGTAFDLIPAQDGDSWPGETAGAGPVSRLTGASVVTVQDLAALPSGDRYAVRLVGGLQFIEPALSPELDWYGRVLWPGIPGGPASLITLAYVQFHWNEHWREIRLSLPTLGYPLSGQLPRVDKDGMPVGLQPDAVVAGNRARTIAAFLSGPDALGFARAEVAWSVESEADASQATREALAAALARSVAGEL